MFHGFYRTHISLKKTVRTNVHEKSLKFSRNHKESVSPYKHGSQLTMLVTTEH